MTNNYNDNDNDNYNLITFVMYYSLFHKQFISNESDIIKTLPKNAFGIFSTVRRARKVKSYPIDIHGCIGYWDNNFTSLNKSTLYNNLLRVAYDSVWTDTRNKYFTPIETDPDTALELDFMLNPIYNIHKNTGIIAGLNAPFRNKTFGIIIQTKDKAQKATYLPGVFPNISWDNMIISLKSKANITSNDFQLFAYKITQIKSTFLSILTSEIFTYNCIFNFSRLLIDNMKLNLPFPFIYACKNNILEWNNNDDVRNISTLSDVFKYINLYPDIATNTEFKNVKHKIFTILQNIDQYSSQSLSCLGYIYKAFNIKNAFFCEKLLHDLPFSENDFEKPEIVIGLNNAGCLVNEKQHPLTYYPSDSIFKMNLIIHTLVSFNKKPSRKLVVILENKIDEILSNKKNTETNFIAVAFEALCLVNKIYNKTHLLHKIFELFFELEQRRTGCNVLYTFLDKTARVDITGHIINGFVELML